MTAYFVGYTIILVTKHDQKNFTCDRLLVVELNLNSITPCFFVFAVTSVILSKYVGRGSIVDGSIVDYKATASFYAWMLI